MFKDHFSDTAASYAQFRPRYPEPLMDWLAGVAPGRALAWDAATGNGQAVALAEHFERVVATDASAEQIANAPPHPRLVDGDVDLALQEFAAVIKPFWPPERAITDDGYRSLAFPFAEIDAAFELEMTPTLAECVGYLRTLRWPIRIRAGVKR